MNSLLEPMNIVGAVVRGVAQGVTEAVAPPPPPTWGTEICQCKDTKPGDWIYACFCPLCAASTAKSRTNHTNPCFNFCCFPPQATAYSVRAQYGLPGSCTEDLFATLFCGPCVIRRLLHETKVRSTVPDLQGPLGDKWHVDLVQCKSWSDLGECLLMTINPCYYSSMAYLVLWKVKANNLKDDKDEGCDRCMLACCTVPCAAYGEARQQYGIESEFPAVGWFCYPCAIRRASMESVSRVG
eukprot:PhF_6_TR8733/c0_g1_i1/m.13731